MEGCHHLKEAWRKPTLCTVRTESSHVQAGKCHQSSFNIVTKGIVEKLHDEHVLTILDFLVGKVIKVWSFKVCPKSVIYLGQKIEEYTQFWDFSKEWVNSHTTANQPLNSMLKKKKDSDEDMELYFTVPWGHSHMSFPPQIFSF